MIQKFLNIALYSARTYTSVKFDKSTIKTSIVFSKIMSNSDTNIKKPRYDGRTKKRQWEERRSDRDPKNPKQAKVEGDGESEAYDRIRRRKFVLLLGYSGVDYYGMQRNPKMKTIEEELFNALLKCEFINKECYDQVQNMHFQRAARTDKGVSAARQICSMKLGENLDIEKLNENLPEVIRIFASKRVTKGFNSKQQCDGRTYIYILPTVAFANSNKPIKQNEYRISEEKLAEINDLLKNFEGTKNFHNFTSKKKYNDPSASRFIRSFICEKPFVREGIEFVVLKVYGQSFMLHQIRKMVGLTLAIIRGVAPKETLLQAFKNEKVCVPRAPGLGLVLDQVHYERYNHRYGKDGMHETLTWDEVEDKVNDFKEKYIYPTIINTEINEESMVQWLEKLDQHTYDEDEEDDDEKDDNESDDEERKYGKEKKSDKNEVDNIDDKTLEKIN